MEQHAIPQQISSYEFKLVGDMTLKQFLKAAGGILVAILINTTNIMIIIKWPLMLMFGGLGVALAFLPFDDRPIETWITSFIKSIYSPTIFIYNKKNDNSWLGSPYLKDEEDGDDLKPVENKNLFVSVKKQVTEGTMAIDKKDDFGVSVNQIDMGEEVIIKKETKNLIVDQPVEVKSDQKDLIEPISEATQDVDTRTQTVELNLKKDKLEATGKAVFGTIPMPNRPDVANLIVGMATNQEGKIVDGVIIEIQDEHGSPTRVIKTNSLGQFKISTPLASGRYLIIAEKEGYTFDRVNIDLTGQIIDPIKIIAQN